MTGFTLTRPVSATVVADASYCSSRRVGGWAAWVRVDNVPTPIKGQGVLKPYLSNSTDAEVYAALNGAWLACHNGATHVLVQSDCMAVIHLLQGTTRSPRLLKLWSEAMQIPEFKGRLLRGRHIRGHQEVQSAAQFVQDWADSNARKHMRKARGNHHAR